MEITWQGIVGLILVVVVLCFIAGFIETALEQRKRNREQEEWEALKRSRDERKQP